MSLQNLEQKKLVINIGKGGVGKSSVSAAMAVHAAKKGKKVLICEVNAKEKIPSMLQKKKPENIEHLDQIWQVDDRIWAVNMTPRESLKEYIVQVLRLRLLYNVVFENRFIRSFLQAIPGLQDLVFIGKVWFHVQEILPDGQHRFDLVILDAPSTGHGIAMLRIPDVVINIVPAGPMHQAALKINSLLMDNELTAIHLITLPEEMPINETIQLYEMLSGEKKYPLGDLFLNQWPKVPYERIFLDHFEQYFPLALKDPRTAALFSISEEQILRQIRAERFRIYLQKKIPLRQRKIGFMQTSDCSDIVQELSTILSKE